MEHNPNHPTTQAMRGQWHKIAALLLHKWKGSMGEVKFSSADIDDLGVDDLAIVVGENSGVITVRLVTNEEAERLAREEGGLPV